MEAAHQDPTRDPGSGYASADVLDPEAAINHDQSREGDGEALQDAMNGYASIDTLDPTADVNHHWRVGEGPETPRTPLLATPARTYWTRRQTRRPRRSRPGAADVRRRLCVGAAEGGGARVRGPIPAARLRHARRSARSAAPPARL